MLGRFTTRFSRCNQGVATIEFALIATMLFTILVGFMEMALIFFASSVIEGATGISARTGKTGYTAAGMSREEFIRQKIADLSFGVINTNELEIEILSYNGFANVGQPEPCIPITDPPPCINGFEDINGNGQWDADQGIAGPGSSGGVVLYRVTYPWPLFTPLISGLVGDEQGIYNIQSIATIKNEPF
ncbi:MAG: TadE/TadG family type IV pilus assembly protein [Rickettsiales bacterium]